MTVERAVEVAQAADVVVPDSLSAELREALQVLSATAMRAIEYGKRVAAGELVRVVRCKNCAHEDLFDCPLCHIESQTLHFVAHEPDFYCAKGEPVPL